VTNPTCSNGATNGRGPQSPAYARGNSDEWEPIDAVTISRDGTTTVVPLVTAVVLLKKGVATMHRDASAILLFLDD